MWTKCSPKCKASLSKKRFPLYQKRDLLFTAWTQAFIICIKRIAIDWRDCLALTLDLPVGAWNERGWFIPEYSIFFKRNFDGKRYFLLQSRPLEMVSLSKALRFPPFFFICLKEIYSLYKWDCIDTWAHLSTLEINILKASNLCLC